jgi:hypothetical protein
VNSQKKTWKRHHHLNHQILPAIKSVQIAVFATINAEGTTPKRLPKTGLAIPLIEKPKWAE